MSAGGEAFPEKCHHRKRRAGQGRRMRMKGERGRERELACISFKGVGLLRLAGSQAFAAKKTAGRRRRRRRRRRGARGRGRGELWPRAQRKKTGGKWIDGCNRQLHAAHSSRSQGRANNRNRPTKGTTHEAGSRKHEPRGRGRGRSTFRESGHTHEPSSSD